MGALLGTVPNRWLSVTCHLHPAASRWREDRFTLGGGLAALTPRSLQTSVLCKAAVHAGVVADEAGGQVTLSREKGITLYESAFANGLHSKRWAQGSQLPPPQCQSPPAGFCWVFALQDHS